MKLGKEKMLFLFVFGLLIGNLCTPDTASPFLGKASKIASKAKKVGEKSIDIYGALKKDVELLTQDKKNLENDFYALKAIPGELEKAILKVKDTLTKVGKNLVKTKDHVIRTGKDVGKITAIVKILK